MTKITKTLSKQVGNERTFQLRNVGSNGCGSYEYFNVTGDTPEEEIFELACTVMTEAMESAERRYLPSPFREAPKWRMTIKVVEMRRNIVQLSEPNKRTGRDWRNEWLTKKKGLKFKICNSWCEVTYTDGSKKRSDGYTFSTKI